MHLLKKNLWQICVTFICIFLSSRGFSAPLPVIELKLGKESIQAEVASTPSTQQLGLMFRKELGTNAGMLFIFSEKAGHCFWMKNTLIPLSIAFLEDDGKIINIEEMQPQTEDNHCPKKVTRFALEMNKEWFSSRKIGAGSVISGLPKF
jgi:uncharacterized membrane protein (UPF0127 family)